MSKLLYDVWLSLALGAGSQAYRTLNDYFKSSYEIYRAEAEELSSVGLTPRQLARLSDKDIGPATLCIENCRARGISVIVQGDPEYPQRLAAIPTPPFLLYVMGTLPAIDRDVSVAVVGTRRMSEYGMNMAYRISYGLSSAGAVVVSGMALGIDAAAACGALDAHGSTVAVLGCGLDRVYPSAHAQLMSEIAARGAVISEYPFGTPPMGANFPMRNRIISGLSLGTLVVEAGEGSGAMLTAQDAARQGRTIFAIPGNVGENNAAGTNALIHDGARIVLSASDILSEYSLLYSDRINTDAFAASSVMQGNHPVSELLAAHGVTPAGAAAPRSGNPAPAAPAVRRDKPSAPTRPVPEVAPTTEDRTKNGEKSKKKYIRESEKKTATGVPDALLPLQSLPPLPAGKMKQVYDLMTPGELTTADTFAPLGFSAGEIVSLLATLEIMGYVVSRPGGFYVRGE